MFSCLGRVAVSRALRARGPALVVSRPPGGDLGDAARAPGCRRRRGSSTRAAARGATSSSSGGSGAAEGVDFSPGRGRVLPPPRPRRRAARARSSGCPSRTAASTSFFATDVIEHLDDDRAALAELRRVAAPGARLVLTVPAYSWLWSEHDVSMHHRRRYTEPRLRERVAAAGLGADRALVLLQRDPSRRGRGAPGSPSAARARAAAPTSRWRPPRINRGARDARARARRS